MNTNNSNKQYLTLKDVWNILLGNIWLFVASVVLTVSIAVVYIAVTPPTYKRTASILIKDESKGQSIQNTAAAFEDMGLVQTNTDINNEIHILATPQLMEEVVNRLSLQYTYSLKYKNIRWVDLYHSTPFIVKLDSTLQNHNITFNFRTDGNEAYKIIDLVINGLEIESIIEGVYGKALDTGYGTLTIEKSLINPINVPDNLYSFSKSSIADVAEGYLKRLVVALRSEDASIIDISLTAGSTQKADDILNTLISVYKEGWIKDKNLITLSTTNFISERLGIIEQELSTVDKDISTYKSENLLPDVAAVTGMNLQSSNEILKEQIALNNELSMAKYLLEYIESEKTKEQLLPVNAGIESAAINEQITTYNTLLLKKNTLLANSSIDNPIVAGLIEEVQSLRKVLLLSVNDIITTLNIQLQNVNQEEITARKKLSNNPSQELYLLSSGRQQKIKEELYLFLLQKREENELNQAFTAYNTKVLNYAKGSKFPIAPQKGVILLFGFVIGCILPIVFLIIKAGFQTTVQSKEDLAGSTIPFLGSVPLVKTKKRWRLGSQKKKKDDDDNDSFVVISNSRDGINEMFRVIRTNFDFMMTETSNCKTAMITSFNPKSGKSFFSFNIALSMAMKNNKVLVIDGDLRRGTLSKVVNNPKKGLVNYLNGSVDNINDVIVKGAFDTTIRVLPMGTMPPNPTELLLTDKFTVLMEKLKSEYDYIFFDCPPIEIVPDASIIEKYCDSTIFVIRAGLMDKALLPDLESLYASKKLKNMSLVLNGVDYSRNSRYGYSKYGYGKYGYGKYGYGSYGNSSEKTGEDGKPLVLK